MTLDSFSVLNTQQCFWIFFCSVCTLKTMSNLSGKNYCRRRESPESVEEFTSTNFNSQNVTASFHIPSGEICAKLTSCLSHHHFSIYNICKFSVVVAVGKYVGKQRETVDMCLYLIASIILENLFGQQAMDFFQRLSY